MVRRRNQPNQRPLGPEDDPYLAYLLWREERDAADAEPANEPTLPEPGRRSWVRRMAIWKRGGADQAGH
jgi:hypothetical protein